jgi:hypothetical protein
MDKPNRFTVQIAKDRHTHVGKLAALNHSCDPNVVLDTEHMLMIARRDIEKGEELSFFYPATEWEMQAPFICLCGSANCITWLRARFCRFLCSRLNISASISARRFLNYSTKQNII